MYMYLGADTSVVKKRHKRNPMTGGREEDRKTPRHGKRAKENELDSNGRAVCLRIKERRDCRVKDHYCIGMKTKGQEAGRHTQAAYSCSFIGPVAAVVVFVALELHRNTSAINYTPEFVS